MTADDPPRAIDLARAPSFRLGGHEVRPATREFAAELIEPRIMQVLVAMADRRGQVISRDELVATCWGGRAVGEDAINRCIQAIRRLAETHGGFAVATVPRVGYRLEEQAPNSQRSTPTQARKPSIAVMAFANLSGDPEQDYFADGMVEEIVAALARFRSIFVIASGSSQSLRGQALTTQEVGERLGVQYLLEGSVRKAASRVRIAVRLVDAHDGAQVWVERFEDTLDDVFALQDKVALAVAAVIAPNVRLAEVRQAVERPTDNPTSHDLFLRAMAHPIVQTAASLEQARDLLDQAIALDPNYGPALSRAAMAYRNRAEFGWSDDAESDRRHASGLAQRALAAAPNDADVVAGAASVLARVGGDIGATIPLLDRALTLNPGSAWAWFISGRLRVAMGEVETGAEQIQTSMRLDPLSPLRHSQLHHLGLARFAVGRLADALALFQQAAQLRPGAWEIQVLIGACQARLGEHPAARDALAIARSLNPGFVPSVFAERCFFGAGPRQLLLEAITAADRM